MRAVSQSEAVSSIATLLEQAQRETVAVQKDGRNVLFIISAEEYASTREAKTRRLLEATDALSAEIARNVEEKGLDLDDLMKSLDRKAS